MVLGFLGLQVCLLLTINAGEAFRLGKARALPVLELMMASSSAAALRDWYPRLAV